MATPPRKRPGPPTRRTPKVAGASRSSTARDTASPQAPNPQAPNPQAPNPKTRTPRSQRAPQEPSTTKGRATSAPVDDGTAREQTPTTSPGAPEGSMATDEATRAVPPSGSDAPTTSETTTDTTTAPDGERTDALTPEARSAPDRATQDESADDDTTADSSGRSGGRPAGKRRPPAARVSTIKPAPPSTTTASRRPARTRSRAPFWTWRKAAVLALLAAVFAVVAVVSAFQPGTSAPANVAFVNLPLTSQIKAQASTRICQVFNIDYTNLDGWQKAGASATTGKASQNFQKYVDGVKQALQQSNVTSGSSDCKVDVVGVKSADDQNAVLLTNLIFSDNRNGVIQGSNTVRYQVDMHNVNGNWLVADFNGF